MPKEYYYAVRIERKPGIYSMWNECLEQVNKINGARYKKFNTRKGAQDFIDGIEDINIKKRVKDKFKKKQDRKIKMKQTTLSIIKDKLVLNNKRIICFTDGACEYNGSDKACGGIGVYWNNEEYENLSEPLPGDLQTNNRAEIYAVIRALEICKDNEKILDIMTDSKYVIDAHESWIKKWIENNWMREKKPVKNRDLFERMEELIKLREKVVFTHVYGHSGIFGNEQADQLANDACFSTT